MRFDEHLVQIACAMAALIAALVLMPLGEPAPASALLRDDGLACSRFAGQNQ
jgi:hypothetical protein